MNSTWLVSTLYEMVDIRKYMNVKQLTEKLIHEFENHLNVDIGRFGQEKDDTELYLLGKLGVLGIKTIDMFEIKGFFIEETDADKFKTALSKAINHTFSKEIAGEMLSNLTIVETGAEITWSH